MNHDLIAREFMNGTMSVLAIVLTFAMGYRLWLRIGTPLWWNEGTQAIIAVFIFMLAEDIRAGWVWVLLSCQNEYGREGCTSITSSYEVLYVATVFAVVGKTCCIRVFSPPEWRPWTWVGAGIAAIVIPFIVHLF